MANQNKNNVDLEEIEKFNLLAHKWWDPTSEFKPLHEINPLRLNFIKSSVNLKEKKVLDVGCGGGILSESLASAGADVTGIDQGDKVIQIAKLHAKESGVKIKYKHINIEDFYKNTDERFDVITCLEMLEHVPDPNSIINTCSKLLKPGGKAYFAVRRDLYRPGFRIHKKYGKKTWQCNVTLPYRSVLRNKYCEIYEYRHFTEINKNILPQITGKLTTGTVVNLSNGRHEWTGDEPLAAGSGA